MRSVDLVDEVQKANVCQFSFGAVTLYWFDCAADDEVEIRGKVGHQTFILVESGRILVRVEKIILEEQFLCFDGASTYLIRTTCTQRLTVATMPNILFQQRLLQLMPKNSDMVIRFLAAAEGDGRDVKLLCDQLLALREMPILRASREMADGNESLAQLVLDCFITLYPSNYSSLLGSMKPQIAPKHVKRALDFIHRNPQKPCGLKALAALSSVSVRSLQYSFQSVTGQTVSDYQRDLRLSRAYKAVVSPDNIPFKQIAADWGYRSASAFAQSFKRAFGLSPREARALYGEPKGQGLNPNP